MTTVRQAELCSVWLLPRAEDAAALTTIIDELAARFAAPRFSPHLTLLADLRLPAERVKAALANTSPPHLRLTTQGLDHSARRFESLTVRFSPSDPLTALRTRVADELRWGAGPKSGPHMSLLYPVAPLDAAVLHGLCDELAPRIAPAYLFDGLCAVRPGGHDGDWHDVARWTLL